MHRRALSLRVLVVVMTLGLLAGACADQEVQQRQAEFPDDGIQLTGRVGRAQLSVSYGDPDFLTSDCDVEDGFDKDWCLRARSIDGADVLLILENPAIAVAGADVAVVRDLCGACDEVSSGAVMDLAVDGVRRRAIGGSLQVTSAGPDRYIGEFRLRFDDGGTVTGDFNVRPLGVLVPAPGDDPTSDDPSADDASSYQPAG